MDRFRLRTDRDGRQVKWSQPLPYLPKYLRVIARVSRKVEPQLGAKDGRGCPEGGVPIEEAAAAEMLRRTHDDRQLGLDGASLRTEGQLAVLPPILFIYKCEKAAKKL